LGTRSHTPTNAAEIVYWGPEDLNIKETKKLKGGPFME